MQNIGIFIDGENINPKDYSCVYEEISSLGRVIVSRVYADWSSSLTEKWNELAINYALEMIHCAKLPRKNSVDIRIIDDIYEFLYETQTVDKYYLISTDADFITPARRVRRKGKEFYGVGYSNSSLLLKNVCDKFIPIEMLRKDVFEDEIPQPKTIQNKQNKQTKKEKKEKKENKDKLKLRLEKRRLKRQRKRQKKENSKKQNEEQNNKVLEELEEFEEFEINTSSTSSSDEEEEEDFDNYSTAESAIDNDDENNEIDNKKIVEDFVQEIIGEAINNVLPINSLDYLSQFFPQGLRYVRLKNLYQIISEKRANFNISIEEFKEELCKNDKLLVLPNKFDKITIYDMSSLNDSSCEYLWEQINKILEKNENKMIISALKEQLEKQTLLFDQRIWGFTKIKEFLKICFPNKYEFTENEIILV